MYIPVFRRHLIKSNWEELKKQSKIEEPNYHQLEHLLAKVAFPRSPVYQVGGVGAEGYTNFMREYVEMIIVPTANNFVKLTLAWSWERNGNYPYLFTAVNVQNDATSEELELATFRYCTGHRHSNPQNDFFSWHDGIKLRYCTDFAVTPNEENMMLLKQWLNLGSAVSELQMYHFFRLLMLEFKPLSLLEMKPTVQMAREKLSILLSLTENTTEFHRTFVDLLSQMHLLTNKWLIKANLIKVLQHSDAFLHLFYNITPQTKLELDQLMEDMFLITWEEEIAAYDALYEDPQKDIWTSYLRHMIITFPKLLSTQAKNEESIIIEWIVDEWENEEYGYNLPLTLILEPFTSKVGTK
jgi:hypothetical protein